MWNQVCQALPGVALCDLDDWELRDGRWDPNLVRSGSGGGGDVDESGEEGVHGAVPVGDRGALVIGERDSREHPLKVVLRLEQLALARLLGGVEVAAGAGHPVLALLEEAVAAPAVPEVVVLPRLPICGAAGGDGVADGQPWQHYDLGHGGCS